MNEASMIDRSLIAAISLDPVGAAEQVLGLSPEMLEAPAHQLFLRRWYETGDVTLALVDAGLYNGDLAAWRSMIGNDPACLPVLVQQVISRSRKSAMGRNLSDALAAFSGGNVEEATRLARMAAEMDFSGGVKLLDATDLAQQFIDGLDSARGAFVKTGIRPIDSALGGLLRGNLSIVGGRPGMGKSALLGQIARNVAEAGLKVIFCEFDMSGWKVLGRYALGDSGNGVRFRDVVQETYPRRALDAVKARALAIGQSLQGRLKTAPTKMSDTELLNAALVQKPDLIIVDLISQLAVVREKNEPEYAWHGRKAEALAYIARRCNCHALAAVQIGRQVEQRGDKRPGLSDLRDSGRYEEQADNVMLLYRDGYYEDETDETGNGVTKTNLEINILKNRDGSQNIRIDVECDLARQRIQAYRTVAEKKMLTSGN